jgi:ABC-type lipoprotein export system ATPase subunit
MIELENVWKRFGSTEILKGINLTVNEGDFVCIRGKSGVGKSSLLKIIGFLDTPDEGKVKVLGKEIHELSDGEKSKMRLNSVGFVFQFFNLIPSLTVLENIELPLALAAVKKSKRQQRALELVDYFGLTNLADRFPDSLSGGERQRIAVIRALSNNPKIILADEPTSSIDDENSAFLMNLLSNINREKKVTIILTTTDLYEPLPVNTNYMLKDGKLEKHP